MARVDIAKNNIDYAFYTDGPDGYLFADLKHTNVIDTAIQLRGVTDFRYYDIQ